ncbi:MAG: tetratricopeptide repeat protein, partial [FCB group bacterium]|nr:tetratricopeptide repeat protein [FCB group bacterium]
MVRFIIGLSLVSLIFGADTDKGLEAYRSGNYEAARKYYEAALKKGENPEAMYGYGVTVYKQGDIETAME